ncbi:MAG: hypothetical protein K2J58_01890, partial [Muribaculaceae bacterium]|nr:hypothetical protein [Muribaculaceae bacterium]
IMIDYVMPAYKIHILKELHKLPPVGGMIHRSIPSDGADVMDLFIPHSYLHIHKGISGTIARCFP